MKTPFPGMDPYLEHPVLWEGVHARLIARIADQLQPLLDPRYVATVEERVFVEGPQRRIPDVRIDRVEESNGCAAVAVAPPRFSAAFTIALARWMMVCPDRLFVNASTARLDAWKVPAILSFDR